VCIVEPTRSIEKVQGKVACVASIFFDSVCQADSARRTGAVHEKGEALGHLADYDVRPFPLALIAKPCPARPGRFAVQLWMGSWRVSAEVHGAVLAHLPTMAMTHLP